VILDTNAVSDLLEGNAALEALLGRSSRHELPVIVIGEYRYGLARSRRSRTLLPLLEELIRESIVLPLGVETAAAYAVVRDALRAQGTPIPENDVWISALAVEHGLDVVSRDTDFDRVAGIRRRGW
jgi:predicted nucleic acid-binding protein